INRGMRLEAIAALLGHQKMEMTLIYAKIANRVVAGEYAAVSTKIDALSGQPPELPADYDTTGMARLRREAHARTLGNGLCTRPSRRAWPPSPATPPTASTPSVPTCTGLSSSSASATANSSSASQRHDHQHRRGAPA